MTTEQTSTSTIALDLIDPDPGQPRKTFNQAKLDELTESIRIHGVVKPLILRPHPTKNHGHRMLIDGERRWRGAKAAGLTEVPFVLRELDDKGARELQLLTNSYDEDLPPLEEAACYQDLLDSHAYTMDMLVERTGKSRSYLYARLNLLKLAAGVKKALVAGRISASIATLAGTIPNHKLQEQYIDDVLGTWKDDDRFERTDSLNELGIQHEDLNDTGKPGWSERGKPQPLSFRAAQVLLHRKFSTRLAVARFDPSDSTLTEAGACGPCPHRSGNQPELFPDLAKPDDVCLNPSCFEKKTAAVWNRAKADARERGLEVIEGDDAKGVFLFDGSTMAKSAFIDPKAEIPAELQKSPGATATWSKLLGKKLEEVPRVLVQDPSGAPRELVDQKKAVEILRDLGKIDRPVKSSSASSGSGSPSNVADRSAAAKEKEKREIHGMALERLLAEAASKAGTEVDEKKALAWLRWIARAFIYAWAEAGIEGGEPVLKRRGIETYDELSDLVEKSKSLGNIRAVLVELALAIATENKITGWSTKVRERELFDDACKLFGLDWDKAVKAAKEASKAEAKADAAKDAKKAPAKKGASK